MYKFYFTSSNLKSRKLTKITTAAIGVNLTSNRHVAAIFDDTLPLRRKDPIYQDADIFVFVIFVVNRVNFGYERVFAASDIFFIRIRAV